MEELETETSPASIADKMAEAGFGTPTQTRAWDVLERLKARPPGGGDTPKPKEKPDKPDAA